MLVSGRVKILVVTITWGRETAQVILQRFWWSFSPKVQMHHPCSSINMDQPIESGSFRPKQFCFLGRTSQQTNLTHVYFSLPYKCQQCRNPVFHEPKTTPQVAPQKTRKNAEINMTRLKWCFYFCSSLILNKQSCWSSVDVLVIYTYTYI